MIMNEEQEQAAEGNGSQAGDPGAVPSDSAAAPEGEAEGQAEGSSEEDAGGGPSSAGA
jgi:hypothetical protein